ncbi:MAG: MmgE/PrpD family protein [Paracoccaceae bacterium]|nr:MmgE/PrpD family protein [Paracoccaceae bacterium]
MSAADFPMSRISQFTFDLQSHQIPVDVVKTVRLLLLDTMGIWIAATPMEAGKLARETSYRLYNTAVAHDCSTMMFDGRRASSAGAAFAGATQIDNLDGHDGYNPTKGHIGVAVVPSLFAMAEHIPYLSGLDALAALIVGYEVAGRAGIALHETVSDYHTSGAWNGLGVAAMAARLRNSSPEQLREALGIAEYHGPRSQMMREIANPTMLHDGSGMGALVGLSAIIMAEMGYAGAPAITVEADDVSPYWADLGTFWQTAHQYIKPYPICRWAHAAIDGAGEVCTAHNLRPEHIKYIEIRSFHNAVQLFSGMPETTSMAQYSLPFAVANMIAHGQIGLEHISGKGLCDPVVAELVAKTKMVEDARHESRFPAGRWADVTLHLHDGRILASGDTHARGGPERPFSETDIIDKYMAFAVPVLGKNRAVIIRDTILALDSPTARLADLTRHLVAPP